MTYPTPPERAYLALLDCLRHAATQSEVLPQPHRNAGLHEAFDATGGSLIGRAWLNIADDDGLAVGDLAGGDLGAKEFYQIARLEFAVERKDSAQRDALYDRGLSEIADALHDDLTLGGAVDGLEIEMPRRANLNLAGAPRVKAVSIPIRLLITARSYIG